MTNDDVRRIAAIVRRELRQDVRIVLDGLMRVEAAFAELHSDVVDLKNDKIRREARENERDKQAKLAAELVAEKAADAIAERQWSVKKWTTIIGSGAAALAAMGTLTSVLGAWLSQNPPPGP